MDTIDTTTTPTTTEVAVDPHQTPLSVGLTERLGAASKVVLVKTARTMGWRGDETKQTRGAFLHWINCRRGSDTDEDIEDALAAATASLDPLATLKGALEAIMGQPKVDLESIRAEMQAMIHGALSALQPTKVYVTPAGEWAPPQGELVHEVFEGVLSCAVLRLNVLLVGPAGCGKTALGAQVAAALKLPFGSISCTAGMSESQLGGWLLPLGDGGRFVYVPALFVTMYETGGVFLLDEIDAGDENVLVFLHQALANNGFFLPQRTDNPFVKRHPDFVLLAAANTYGHGADRVYVGRNKLDGATLDRFKAATFPMDYDRKLEEAVVPNKALRAWGEKVRGVIGAHRLARVMSTRFLIDSSKRLAAGHGMDAVKASYLSDWTKDEVAKLNAA
jgi:MoxR-like ATPase